MQVRVSDVKYTFSLNLAVFELGKANGNLYFNFSSQFFKDIKQYPINIIDKLMRIQNFNIKR